MTKQKLLLSLFLLIGMVQGVMAQEPYAALSDDNTVLTFYYDTQKAERNGMSVGPFEYVGYPTYCTTSWYSKSATITTVVFDASFAGCTSLTSTACWFCRCSNLTTITGIENLKTDNVKDMNNMFSDCSSLTSLDVSGLKTDNVTDMWGMFRYCSSLTNLDLSGFKTDNVTDMYCMFSRCSSLTSLNLSGFKTDNVTDMGGMFKGCSSLTSLDLSGFRTDIVTRMSSMFAGCESMTTIYADETKWSTDKVESGGDMFTDCTKLVGGNGTAYNDAHADQEYARIDKPGQSGYFTGKSNGNGIARNVAGVRIACHDRMLTVTGAEGASCQIYDLNGRELTSQGNMGSEARFQLPAADVYLVHIRQKDGQKTVYKIQAQ